MDLMSESRLKVKAGLGVFGPGFGYRVQPGLSSRFLDYITLAVFLPPFHNSGGRRGRLTTVWLFTLKNKKLGCCLEAIFKNKFSFLRNTFFPIFYGFQLFLLFFLRVVKSNYVEND